MLKKNLMKSIACGVLLAPLAAMADGYLENPQPDSTQSGISIISGWHCTANEIEIKVDGVSIGGTGVGSFRNDTVSVCGHNQSGYAVLYNYNIREPGEHTIQVYADGALLETRKFNTVRSGGVPFLSGKSASVTIANFPENGRTTTVEWSQAKQSFVVVDSTTTNGENETGAPSAPWQTTLSSPNPISKEVFFNHYTLYLQKGERLYIQVQLQNPLSDQQKSRCASNPGRGETPSSYDTQIHIYNNNFKRVDGICGESITFTAPESGGYILHFAYGAQSAGVFFADKY